MSSINAPWELSQKNKIELLNIKETIEVTEEILNLIKAKVKILSKEKNPNESADESTSISSVVDKEVDENSKKYLTMSSINKFCRTCIIFLNKFKKNKKISLESIIDFSFELLFE